MYQKPLRALTIAELLRLRGIQRRYLGVLKDATKYPPETTEIITLLPKQTVLAHTQEFVGGRSCIIPFMQARSTTGRFDLTACKDAGMGNIGYVNRWTMEVKNDSTVAPQILVVGYPYAQVAFSLTEALPLSVGYGGRYQEGQTLEEIKANWKPEMMLPKPITPP